VQPVVEAALAADLTGAIFQSSAPRQGASNEGAMNRVAPEDVMLEPCRGCRAPLVSCDAGIPSGCARKGIVIRWYRSCLAQPPATRCDASGIMSRPFTATTPTPPLLPSFVLFVLFVVDPFRVFRGSAASFSPHHWHSALRRFRSRNGDGNTAFYQGVNLSKSGGGPSLISMPSRRISTRHFDRNLHKNQRNGVENSAIMAQISL